MKKRIWLISDTHSRHSELVVPDNIDMVICAGDISNPRDPYRGQQEILNFCTWYSSLPIKHKVLTPGNHDTAFEHKLIDMATLYPSITFLVHEFVDIEGIKIFASPYTPTFGSGWAYNVDRHKIGKYWEVIPDNTDILVTHGPPKGILDLTQYGNASNGEGLVYFQCGCEDLLKRVKKIEPKYHVFGHIHTEANCPNSGTQRIVNCETTFVNASVVNLQYVKNNDGIVIEI